MKRSIPTLLIILAILVAGAAYWADLKLFTDPDTGFVTYGSIWVRYIVLLLVPIGIAFTGISSVGPRGLSVFRVKNPFLGVVFLLGAISAMGFGAICMLTAFSQEPLSKFQMIMGILYLWYGVWMVRSSIQMFTQRVPSPSVSALWGVLAAVPFCMQTIYRVLIKPASLYRMAPTVRIFAALFSMLWFGMLLRGLYIAMVRSRVRWMYLFGLLTFLMGIMELVQEVYTAFYGKLDVYELAQGIHTCIVGVVAVSVSLSIAAQADVKAPKLTLVEQGLADAELEQGTILQEMPAEGQPAPYVIPAAAMPPAAANVPVEAAVMAEPPVEMPVVPMQPEPPLPEFYAEEALHMVMPPEAEAATPEPYADANVQQANDEQTLNEALQALQKQMSEINRPVMYNSQGPVRQVNLPPMPTMPPQHEGESAGQTGQHPAEAPLPGGRAQQKPQWQNVASAGNEE